jgi:hypothetical protein
MAAAAFQAATLLKAGGGLESPAPLRKSENNYRYSMRKALPWLIIVVALILAYVFYSSRASEPRLNIDPHAREEIEKAKRR